YSLSTNTMEPEIDKGSILLSTNISKPNQDDLIIFEYEDSFIGHQTYVFRVAGISNDTLQLKKGVLYRNGKNIDTKLNLVYDYKVSVGKYRELEENHIIESQGT